MLLFFILSILFLIIVCIIIPVIIVIINEKKERKKRIEFWMSPYRAQAEVETEDEREEVVEMHDNELFFKIWKMVLSAIVSVVIVIVGYCIFGTIATNHAALRKLEIETSEQGVKVAEARALEAKALRDKAMFEQMKNNK